MAPLSEEKKLDWHQKFEEKKLDWHQKFQKLKRKNWTGTFSTGTFSAFLFWITDAWLPGYKKSLTKTVKSIKIFSH
jgi:hypothetical protein